MGEWFCTRCRLSKPEITATGCGKPNYTVPVPYETGVEYERPACPLAYQFTLSERLRAFFKGDAPWR